MRSIILGLCAASALATPMKAAADCTRESLKAVAESYIAAQTAGQFSTIKTLADTVEYLENDKKMDIKSGVLSKAMKIDHVRHSLDTGNCATYSEVIITESKNPYVIGTQIRLGADGKITKMESIVTDKDDWLFNAANTLKYANQEKWDVIPEEKRNTREVIKAAGDAYLDLFKNKSTVVPWGTPCTRLEGGSYTGRGAATDSCNVGVPQYATDLIDRRYVIDETMGAVDVFLKFGPRQIPDSHEFRVENGKLRFVHTMTAMDGRKGLPSRPG